MSADDSLSQTDAIFARAYASAIKSKFGVNLGPQHVLLTSPVTQRGIAAGNLIYSEMTNYLMYRFADNLQFADNPSYTGGSAGSYIQQLQSYVNWIETKGDHSQVMVNKVNEATEAFETASKRYNTVLKEANAEFKEVSELYPGVDFWSWASNEYPALGQAADVRATTNGRLLLARREYDGPDAPTIGGFIQKLNDAQTGTKDMTGYNQKALTEDSDLLRKAVAAANSGTKIPDDEIKIKTAWVPQYGVSSYSSTIQDWIRQSGEGKPRDQSITIDISQGRNTKWEDYGFKNIQGGGGGGFWPFFHAEVKHGQTTETRNLDTKGKEDSIGLTLRMIGVQKFNVDAGLWDIPNVQVLFPNRRAGAPKDVLGPKFARVVNVLVGYDVELKVKFSSEFREEVNRYYEEVKSTKGSLTIFGFRVSAGGGGGSDERVVTKFEDLKWDKTTGEMTLTPTSKQVYPTILGVVAQRLG